MHGIRGAVKYRKLFDNTKQLESLMIMSLIEAHSIGDEQMEFVFERSHKYKNKEKRMNVSA